MPVLLSIILVPVLRPSVIGTQLQLVTHSIHVILDSATPISAFHFVRLYSQSTTSCLPQSLPIQTRLLFSHTKQIRAAITNMANTTDSLRAKLRHLSVLKGSVQDANLDALPDTPHAAFKVWLDKAIAEGVAEPHAMTLSTVDDKGWPDARVLILKNVDSRGWHFAIKADSPKGQQISTNQRVALTFYWPQQARQVRLRGQAVQLPEAECIQDFTARPLGSKVSAVASKQSQVMKSPEELARSLVEAQSMLEASPDHIMLGWKVYAVAPDVVEFWQGKADRLHERLQYVRHVGEVGWEKQHLWP